MTTIIKLFPVTFITEKEKSWQQEMEIIVKSESKTGEDIEMGTSDGFGDDDDGDDGGDDDDDEDSDYGKKVFKPLLGKSKRICENRNKLFEEIAENLCANEDSKDASVVIARRNGVRAVIYTVEELNRGKYKCSLCGYNFLWKCHLEVHQAKNPYCVQKKNVTITETDVLKESITFENIETGVEVTSTFQELLDSQIVDPISCAVCGHSGFSNRGKLREHLVLHNESDIFECNVCCTGFTTVAFLSSHLKEHFKKPYECHSCQWRFTSELKLKQHKIGGCRSVSLIDNKNNSDLGMDNTSFRCSVCLCEVVGIKTLRKHLETEHSKRFGRYDCVLCNKKLTSTKVFQRHMLFHKYQYSCPVSYLLRYNVV